jgi:hypothetical protein
VIHSSDTAARSRPCWRASRCRTRSSCERRRWQLQIADEKGRCLGCAICALIGDDSCQRHE